MKTKLIQHSDGGHSWLGVKRTMLKELGILEKITAYSFQKGQMVYLEEDADVSTFAEAVFKLPGNEGKKLWDIFEIKTSYSERSPVRNYPRFSIVEAPKLVVGLKVTLYGKEYTITGTNFKGNWIISGEAGTYTLTKNQESEVRNVVPKESSAKDDGVNYETISN